MGKTSKQKYKGRVKRYNNLNKDMLFNNTNVCSELITKSLNNAKYLLKLKKSNFNKLILFYSANGINISKAYLSELKSGKTKTCNILILQFIASYLNIPLINLLTIDYTLNDNIKPIELNDTISSF